MLKYFEQVGEKKHMFMSKKSELKILTEYHFGKTLSQFK